MKKLMTVGCALLGAAAFAAIEPLSPKMDETVALLPDLQKKVLALPTLAERLRFFAENPSAKTCDCWRVSAPLVFSCRTTEGERGPWKVVIGKKPDLSDARNFFVRTSKVDAASGRAGEAESAGPVVRIEVPMANLEIGTRYYWKVVNCRLCGWGCHPKHGCAACTNRLESAVVSFVTEDLAPRWIAIEGRVGNIRDLGGRRGLGGRRVRQGLVYRGRGLNDNSVSGDVHGRNRLTVEDVDYLTGTLGIKTDLDLRGIGETADLCVSPLGERVRLTIRSSPCYKAIFGEEGMRVMAANFREFCDRRNYPVYFHCIGGADRTGSLGYVLLSVLGVSRQEAETDWESTFYPNIPDSNPDPNFWCRESHFNDGLAKYGDAGTPWAERVILYLKACGITDAEIAEFRNIMLEDR